MIAIQDQLEAVLPISLLAVRTHEWPEGYLVAAIVMSTLW